MARGTWKTVLRTVDRLYADGTCTGYDDGQLLARFAAAREESNRAFEAIVERHGPMVLDVCRRVLDDHHAAEDAFQATFLVLAHRAGSLSVRSGGSLGPWLYEVACRTARKVRRTSTRVAARERRAAEPRETVEAGHPPCLDRDEHRVLHEEVARLPAKYRAAIVLCYFEGLTHNQAAESLRWPVGTVRGYLARARDLLRTRLIGRGVVPAVAAGLLTQPPSSAAATVTPALVEAAVRTLSSGSATAQVAVLAGSIARGLVLSQVQRTVAMLFVMALGVGGAGLAAAYLREQAPPDSRTRPAAVTATPPAPKLAAPSRADLYGDPLPEGAVSRLGTIRLNHAAGVGGVAFTPDGKSLLSFGWPHGIARVWDPSTGRERYAVQDEEPLQSRGFARSPDGRTLISGERDHDARCQFRLWDIKTGRELRRQPLPEVSGFSKVLYAPDGKTLATLLTDGSIVLWDAETLTENRRFKLNPDQFIVMDLAFSPDSRTLALATAHSLALRARAQGTVPPVDPTHEKGSVRLWDVASGREIRRLPAEGCDTRCVAFSPDGTVLAASDLDGTIRLFDPAKGAELAQLNVAGPRQECLAFSPDGKVLASSDASPRRFSDPSVAIHFWNVAERTELRRSPPIHAAVREFAFSPDGTILASAGVGNAVCLWEVSTGREIVPAANRSRMMGLVVSPADGSVITAGGDGVIRRWDAARGREVGVIARLSEQSFDLAISPGGRYLLGGAARLRFWNLSTGAEFQHLKGGHQPGLGIGIGFSRDGRLVTAGGKVWDFGTGQELSELRDEQDKPFQVWPSAQFTPDGTGLIATNGSVIGLWDVATGQPIRRIAEVGFLRRPAVTRALLPSIASLVLSPDGRFVAAGVDQAIRLWHVASGQEVKHSMRHEATDRGAFKGYVTLAFSPDGRLLVSGSGGGFSDKDTSVRVWELATGGEVRRFDGHRAGIHTVAFFPDGHRIASASVDATAMVWDLTKPSQTPLHPVHLDQLWAGLADVAARAYRAIWDMAADPDRSVAFLSDRLKPIREEDPGKDTSLGPITSGETLRRLRAIAVLEKIATPEARRVLERLAMGFGIARETRDAKAALQRFP